MALYILQDDSEGQGLGMGLTEPDRDSLGFSIPVKKVGTVMMGSTVRLLAASAALAFGFWAQGTALAQDGQADGTAEPSQQAAANADTDAADGSTRSLEIGEAQLDDDGRNASQKHARQAEHAADVEYHQDHERYPFG